MYKGSVHDCCAVMPFNNALFMLLKTLLSNEESDQLRTSSFGKIIDFFKIVANVLLGPALTIYYPEIFFFT